jgi:two-component system chemotaxis sensor kinase CheA
MAQMGELQVARIGMEQILEDVYSLIQEVDSWYSMWRQVRHLYTRINAEMVESDTTFALHRSASPGSIGQQARLKRMIGFLHSNEKNLLSSRGNLQHVYKKVKTDIYRMEQVVSDIQDTVRQIRMLPIGTAFDSFPRLVRDLARSLGKEIDFSIEGDNTEVDRSIIEKIKAPLIHLLRNAVDHGIEMPEERLAAGKPRRGSIRISVWQYGSNVKIEVRDDGRGIDVSAVRANAVEKGILTKEAAESMEDQDILWMIFRTGLSTRDVASDISGRGIGLDVVRDHIDQMHGVIEVSSNPGKGTSFLLTLPLTVATTLAVVVSVGRHLFALPASNVIRIVRMTDRDWGYAEGRRVFRLAGRSIMLTDLADVLGLGVALPGKRPDMQQTALVLGIADQRIVFTVDEVIAIHEVVIKQLPKPFVRVKGMVGATILGNGEIVPILHVGDLIRNAFGVSSLSSGQIVVSHEPTESKLPTIMVVDDSITTRTLEKSILETAGFQVHTAVDGEDAWEKLQTHEVDLVVSDVNMPRLDGFGLTERIRSHVRFEDLPVVLVTSLDSREDQERGIEVGANAYITKGAFDQEHLLTTIRKLI